MRFAINVGRLVASIVCGYLLAQSSLWPHASELTALALVGLTIVVLTTRPRMAVTCGFVGGITFWYALLGWARAAGSSSVSGLHFAAFTIAMLEALYLAAWAYLAVRLRDVPVPIAALTAGIFWSAEEMTRTIGTWAMPYGEVGASQSVSVAAAMLPVLGTAGVSAVIVALAYTVARLIAGLSTATAPRRLLVPVALAFLIGVLCFPAPPQGGVRGPSSTAVAVVQIRPYDAGTLRLVLHEARRRLGNRVVTAVAFPEAAFNFPLAQDDVDWLNRWVRETHIPILAGSIVRRNDRRANVVLYFKGAGVPDVYVKQKLVPFGEFIPGKPLFPKLVDLPGGDLDRGDVTPLWVLGTRKVSPLICFEIGFENLALKGVRAGADMLVVVLNDSWFSTPEGSSLQYAVAQARSRSLGIDVVVVAVRGPSAVLHPNGTPVYQGSASDPFVTLSVEGRHATIYAASGDLPLQTAGAGLACYYLAAFLRRRSIRARIARIARSSGGSSSA